MTKSTELQSAPLEDEVEVTLLGPGYGESIVVHVGEGSWIIVDSCINDAGKPQALDYLLGMGIDPAKAVELVVATHWHDDHIRGMNELVGACREAEFCCAGALLQREFLTAVYTLDGRGSFAERGRRGSLVRSQENCCGAHRVSHPPGSVIVHFTWEEIAVPLQGATRSDNRCTCGDAASADSRCVLAYGATRHCVFSLGVRSMSLSMWGTDWSRVFLRHTSVNYGSQ